MTKPKTDRVLTSTIKKKYPEQINIVGAVYTPQTLNKIIDQYKKGDVKATLELILSNQMYLKQRLDQLDALLKKRRF